MCVSTMEPAWPVFESFKYAAESLPLKHRRESQAAFDLIVPTTAETPQSAKTPSSTTSYEISQPYSPQIFRSQLVNNVDLARPNRSNLQHAKNIVPPTSHVSLIVSFHIPRFRISETFLGKSVSSDCSATIASFWTISSFQIGIQTIKISIMVPFLQSSNSCLFIKSLFLIDSY